MLQKVLTKQGLCFKLGTKFIGSAKREGGYELSLESVKDGAKSTVYFVGNDTNAHYLAIRLKLTRS
jgi:hypothetical protein